jgi:hypothetical protein
MNSMEFIHAIMHHQPPTDQLGFAYMLAGDAGPSGEVGGTKLPPHSHSSAEVVTVLSGSIGFGLGETFDPAKGEVVKAGSINMVPAKQAHFVWTENEEAIIQIQYTGPRDITFVNPVDDPRKK